MDFIENIEKIRFAEPFWLILVFLIPLIFFIQKKLKLSNPTLLFSSTDRFKKKESNHNNRSILFLRFLRSTSIILIVLSIARPQIDRSKSSILSSGIDIVLAIDLSASMLALDMSQDTENQITRLDVVKDVIKNFISKRKQDRIGLVAFSVDPYLVSALTLDNEHLKKNVDRLKVGLTHQTGTSIGSALAEGINRLRTLKSKSKILIVLTDGKDEPAPQHSPLIYAKGAKKDNIKIYTIAVGTATRTSTYLFDQRTRDLLRYANGKPVIQVANYPVDKDILKKIAQITDAKFFEAKNKSELEAIYQEIDKLEKSEVELKVNKIYQELFQWPLALGILFLILEFLLSKTIFLRIP